MAGATLDRIALISHAHGNLTALEAVLADIDARGITTIDNPGDYVGKGPRGREVVDLCREVVMEGVLDGREEAPFSVSFVRVPYDWESELAYAAAVGMPELEGYALELRDGIYRGNLAPGATPGYHRRPRTPAPV